MDDKKLLDKLCEKYIRDTKTICGMLFCGCRRDDCISYGDIEVCKACLIDKLEKGEL